MTRILYTCLFTFLSLTVSTFAQTVTITDAAGNIIVEALTIDPAGLPTTQILQSIPPGQAPPASSPSATSSGPLTSPPGVPTTSPSLVPITAPQVQQGPLGAPPPDTGPAGPVVYTYTTTDNTGATVAVVDTFTPTTPLSTPFTPPATGTILNYSSWLAMVGTNTVAQVKFSSSQRQLSPSYGLGTGLGVLLGILCGAGLVLV